MKGRRHHRAAYAGRDVSRKPEFDWAVKLGADSRRIAAGMAKLGGQCRRASEAISKGFIERSPLMAEVKELAGE